MRPWTKLAFVLLPTLVLTACGGGGSGDAPTPQAPSLSQLKQKYDGLIEQSYSGLTTEASLSRTEVSAFAMRLVAMYGNDDALNIGPKSRPLKSSKSTARATATSPCSQGGHVAIEDYLNPDGTGAIEIYYHDCEEDQLTLRGPGAVYFHDSTGNHYTNYFDAVTIESMNVKETITGNIESWDYQYDETFNSSVFMSISNVVFTQGTESYRLKNFEQIETIYGSRYRFSGKLYLPEYGYIDVARSTLTSSAQEYFPTEGSILSSGTHGSAELRFGPPTDRLYYDEYSDGSFNLGANITLQTSPPGITIDELVAVNQLNSPPTINSIYFTNTNVNTTDPISIAQPNVSDYEGDPITLTYIWKVDDSQVDEYANRILPSGVAQKGQTVSVTVVASDGKDTSQSDTISLVIGDAPGKTEVVGIEDTVQPNQQVAFQITYTDPDQSDNGDLSGLSFSLEYGPQGMTVSPEGQLSWSSPDLLFGTPQDYEFKINIEGRESNSLIQTVRVEDKTAELPIARSGIEVPQKDYSMWVGNFDAEPGNEILTTDGHSRVMLLESHEDTYVQKWLYPFIFGDSERILKVLSTDQDGNGILDPVIISSKGIHLITNINQPAVNKYKTLDNEYIVAAAIANLDDDMSSEVAILISDDYYAYGDVIEIRVIDMELGIVQWSTPMAGSSHSILIGNVDSDPALEIIQGDGLVYDSASWTNQWFHGSGFGDLMALGDFDNDGIQEIAAADRWSPVSLFDAVEKSLVVSTEDRNTCSLYSDNTDTDPQAELLVGDCQWGNIQSLDFISGTPTEEWSTTSIEHGSTSIATGDTNNDGFKDVLWGSGVSSSGEDILVILTPATNEVWSNTDPAQLDSFIAAGWGPVSPGDNRAVFISPSTDSGYSGPRSLILSLNGDLEVNDYPSDRVREPRHAEFIDYDRDGYAELFMGTRNTDDTFLQVSQIYDNVIEWTSLGDSTWPDLNYLAIEDVNDDQFEDAIYVVDSQIQVVDIYNQTLIWTSSSLNTVYGIDVANFEGESPNLVTASYNNLAIWHLVEGAFIQRHSLSQTCKIIYVMDAHPNAGEEIICVEGSNYNSYNEVTQFTLYDKSLNEIANFELDGYISNIIQSPSCQYCALITISNPYQSSVGEISSTSISLLSVSSGRLIWQSPYFPGEAPKNSLYQFEENGKSHLTFATDKVMYLTR